MPKPIVGITMGDPVGVGPEVLVKALAEGSVTSVCRPVVLGDNVVLNRALALTGVSLPLCELDAFRRETFKGGNTIGVVSLSNLRLEET